MQGRLENTKTKSQCEKILEHLQSGKSLTCRQAFKMGFGMNLRSRISNLRDKGHKIKSEKVKIQGTYVARYTLERICDEV